MDEKMLEYDRAPFGVIGLETALAVALKLLYHDSDSLGGSTPARLPLWRIIEMLTIGPARAFGLRGGTLAIGSTADITILDPNLEWMVDPVQFKSKSRNTPFGGWQLKGRAVATYVGGRQVFELGR
jgi:dihydroorotase